MEEHGERSVMVPDRRVAHDCPAGQGQESELQSKFSGKMLVSGVQRMDGSEPE